MVDEEAAHRALLTGRGMVVANFLTANGSKDDEEAVMEEEIILKAFERIQPSSSTSCQY